LRRTPDSCPPFFKKPPFPGSFARPPPFLCRLHSLLQPPLPEERFSPPCYPPPNKQAVIPTFFSSPLAHVPIFCSPLSFFACYPPPPPPGPPLSRTFPPRDSRDFLFFLPPSSTAEGREDFLTQFFLFGKQASFFPLPTLPFFPRGRERGNCKDFFSFFPIPDPSPSSFSSVERAGSSRAFCTPLPSFFGIERDGEIFPLFPLFPAIISNSPSRRRAFSLTGPLILLPFLEEKKVSPAFFLWVRLFFLSRE